MKTDLSAASLYASALLFRFKPRDDNTLAVHQSTTVKHIQRTRISTYRPYFSSCHVRLSKQESFC